MTHVCDMSLARRVRHWPPNHSSSSRYGSRCQPFGRGVETSEVFRFHQQELGSGGTAVLVWTIIDSGDRTLVIEPTADR